MTEDLQPLLAQAVANVQRDYPIHWTQTIEGPHDLIPHRELHPLFGGSWDWHSCVHQVWTIVRLLRLHPELAGAGEAAAVLDRLLTREHGEIEARFFEHPRRGGWERPYGWAWLVLLDAELRTWEDPRASRWAQALVPLRATIGGGWTRWIAGLWRPVRVGTHANTAFAAGLVLDAARATGDGGLASTTAEAARRLYGADERYGAYEPDAADFLSPALAEAALLRRVLDPAAFTEWFDAFLPDLDSPRWAVLREPVAIEDGSDPQGSHLIGLNLSRAWCWRDIAAALPEGHRFRPLATAAATAHRAAGWRWVFGEGYAATHWVGAFALYGEAGALTASDGERRPA